MKRALNIFLLLAIHPASKAQILTPVKWSYATKTIDKAEAIIFFKATITTPWHIYSVYQADGGPIKTKFTFLSSNDYSIVGRIIEPKSITKRENVFNMDVHYFENSVVFKQKIKLKNKQTIVNGKVEFMTCNAEKCLPPDEVPFSISVR